MGVVGRTNISRNQAQISFAADVLKGPRAVARRTRIYQYFV
jgi:hypothetical protein